MLSSDFLFPRFFVVPLANPSNFSHCKCFSSRCIYICHEQCTCAAVAIAIASGLRTFYTLHVMHSS